MFGQFNKVIQITYFLEQKDGWIEYGRVLNKETEVIMTWKKSREHLGQPLTLTHYYQDHSQCCVLCIFQYLDNVPMDL